MDNGERGSSILVGVLALGAAVGVAFMGVKGLSQLNESKISNAASRELETLSKSALSYGRYILRERKCFNLKTGELINEKCAYDAEGNLERLLWSDTTARDLAKESNKDPNALKLNEFTLTVNSSSIVAGNPLYAPLRNSSLRVNKIVYRYKTSRMAETGNENVLVELSVNFYDRRGDLLRSRAVKYLLMPRPISSYVLSMPGDLSLGDTNTAANKLDGKIKFHSPMYVGGDVIAPSGHENSLASTASFNYIEHGGNLVDEDGRLYAGDIGGGLKWSEDGRFGQAFARGGLRKVAQEPGLTNIFAPKLENSSLANIGREMRECIDYTNRIFSSEQTKSSQAYVKRERFTSHQAVVDIGLSKLNEFVEMPEFIRASATDSIENSASVLAVNALGRSFNMGLNDRYEARFADFVTSAREREEYLSENYLNGLKREILAEKKAEIKRKGLDQETVAPMPLRKDFTEIAEDGKRAVEELSEERIEALLESFERSEEFQKALADRIKIDDRLIFQTSERKNRNGQVNRFTARLSIDLALGANSSRVWKYGRDGVPVILSELGKEITFTPFNFRTEGRRIDHRFGPNRYINKIVELTGARHGGMKFDNFHAGNAYSCAAVVRREDRRPANYCPSLDEKELAAFQGELPNLREKCLATNASQAGLLASSEVSFLEKAFHSWNFNPVTKEQFLPGDDETFEYARLLNQNNRDDYPYNSLIVGGSNDNMFHVYSVVDHCRVRAQARFFFGFVACRALVIEKRDTPLQMYGSFIVDRISIHPEAEVEFGNIYTSEANLALREAKVLRSMGGDCHQDAKIPSWHPNPPAEELERIKNCQSIELTNGADPFRWTSFNPECGILNPGDIMTTCKAAGRSQAFREFVISEGYSKEIL